jgi:hypothetical protein
MYNDETLKLIFIYNADSGLGNMLIDGAHKILSPSTYECSLCDLTFGAFSEKSKWKKFRAESDVDMKFLHKDEFNEQYASKFGHKFLFPIILAEANLGLAVFVTTEELNNLEKVEDLIALIKTRV